MIVINNLSIELPNFSVSDVSLHIRRGEFFAIMGPTGSGKTLVMESIAGIARHLASYTLPRCSTLRKDSLWQPLKYL